MIESDGTERYRMELSGIPFSGSWNVWIEGIRWSSMRWNKVLFHYLDKLESDGAEQNEVV